MPDTLRVASVQMAISDDIGANLARILRGVSEAKQAGARVVAFPETALSGFDSAAIARLDWPQLDQAMSRIADAARTHQVYVLYGCATRSGKERPFNSAILVGPDGAEVTRYHKMVPESHFEPGDHLALFELDGVPCTMIVCHDERFPELVRVPVLAGAVVCFYIGYEVNKAQASHAKKEGYRAQLIARAVENNIWVVQSSGIGSPPGSGRLSLGNSLIVGPGGAVVAQAPELKDAMIVHDLQPGAATRGNARQSLGIAPLSDWWQAAVERLKAPLEARQAAPPAKTTARLALMKAVPEKWNLDANFATFLRLLDEASAAKADIFITPECWLDGYAAPDKGSTPEKLRAVAQDLDSSEFLKRVAAEAKQRGMFICFGFTSLEDDKIYNAAGLWGADGKRIGVYHKTHLQAHDLQYAPGDSLPVWPTPWGQVGIMICADRRWPETARTLRLKGAKLILNPTYGMHHEANEWWMRTRGYENQCFIAFAHPKVAFVVGPDGELAAKRDDAEPGVLVCEVDLTRAKDDNHLRDRRPELYQIIAAPK
jgi:predicted amidohydrolase